MKLSVIIPAHNEAESIPKTAATIVETLNTNEIHHEILIVDDNSTDNSPQVLTELSNRFETLRVVNNYPPNGFGYAVRKGLEEFNGDVVAIVMADLSDDPNDLVKFYRVISSNNCDCVFGDRWSKGGAVFDYPFHKKIINRLANNIIRFSLGIRYGDATNAFKMYRRETINGLRPFLSPHFNLTIELPLKAIIRGYSYKVVPNSWRNRQHGVSKLRIREMGSRYFFILLYCLIEKFFSRGDFRKPSP